MFFERAGILLFTTLIIEQTVGSDPRLGPDVKHILKMSIGLSRISKIMFSRYADIDKGDFGAATTAQKFVSPFHIQYET